MSNSKNNNLLGSESIAQKMAQLKQEMNAEEPSNTDKKKAKSTPKTSKPLAKESPAKNKPAPKLFISGRLDRKKHTYIAKSLSLLASLEEEIKLYCRGGDLTILNYLIKEGLKNVKKSAAPINVEVEEIETDIS